MFLTGQSSHVFLTTLIIPFTRKFFFSEFFLGGRENKKKLPEGSGSFVASDSGDTLCLTHPMLKWLDIVMDWHHPLCGFLLVMVMMQVLLRISPSGKNHFRDYAVLSKSLTSFVVIFIFRFCPWSWDIKKSFTSTKSDIQKDLVLSLEFSVGLRHQSE